MIVCCGETTQSFILVAVVLLLPQAVIVNVYEYKLDMDASSCPSVGDNVNSVPVHVPVHVFVTNTSS